MGKVKVSDILYEVANLLCVAAERISRGYVPPPPMEKNEWEKVKARVLARSDEPCELAHQPTPFQWFDPDNAPDPACVMVEIQSRWNPKTQEMMQFRWKCWDCNTEGPPTSGGDAALGAMGHLTEQHPGERWPDQIGKM
jgi:hypothetical protein